MNRIRTRLSCRFRFILLSTLLGLLSQAALAQVIVAHYDFENGLEDTTGTQPALTLSGSTSWEPGRIRFGSLSDKAMASIANTHLYTANTAALEIDAWVRTDALLGYGVSAATLVGLYNGWNAMLQFTQDKWAGHARALIGQARQPATAAVVGPYWGHGISHHLQLVLDTAHASLWIDGRLVGRTARYRRSATVEPHWFLIPHHGAIPRRDGAADDQATPDDSRLCGPG